MSQKHWKFLVIIEIGKQDDGGRTSRERQSARVATTYVFGEVKTLQNYYLRILPKLSLRMFFRKRSKENQNIIFEKEKKKFELAFDSPVVVRSCVDGGCIS